MVSTQRSKTEPLENQTLKCSVFEWIRNSNVRYSSPHCIQMFWYENGRKWSFHPYPDWCKNLATRTFWLWSLGWPVSCACALRCWTVEKEFQQVIVVDSWRVCAPRTGIGRGRFGKTKLGLEKLKFGFRLPLGSMLGLWPKCRFWPCIWGRLPPKGSHFSFSCCCW